MRLFGSMPIRRARFSPKILRRSSSVRARVAVGLLHVLGDLERPQTPHGGSDLDAEPGAVGAPDDAIRPHEAERFTQDPRELARRREGPGHQQGEAGVHVGVAHRHHVEIVAVGVAHVEGDDLELREVPGHVVQQDRQRVLALAGRHPAEAGVDVEHDPQLLGLSVERPQVGIVDVGVLRRIELEDAGVPLLDPVLQLPDRVVDAALLDGGDVGLVEEAIRVAIRDGRHVAIGDPAARVTGGVYHRFRQQAGHVDAVAIHRIQHGVGVGVHLEVLRRDAGHGLGRSAPDQGSPDVLDGAPPHLHAGEVLQRLHVAHQVRCPGGCPAPLARRSPRAGASPRARRGSGSVPSPGPGSRGP
jgi:hypothetical protein